MKILFFTNEYAHPKLPSSGGVGSFLKTMAEGMTAQGHEVFVYGFSRKTIRFEDQGIHFEFFKKYAKQFPFSEFLRSLSGKLHIKNTERYFLKKERLYLAKQLKNFSIENQIDLIESFVFNGFTAYWNHEIPLVIRFHGSRGFWHYYLGAKKEEHKIFMEQLALENTPYTVAVSHFSAQAVNHIYNVNINTVIHNGIDANLFSPNPKIPILKHSIFYFGTISKSKGVDILCEVFNDVIIKFPEASLHLIGRGDEFLNYLKSEVLSENALKRMTYHGVKQMNELPDLLSQASMCIFPSLNENFSLAIEEAMALQKPVIASNIPAFKEMVSHGENGYIAETFSDYLKYIELIFTNKSERNRISENARAHILEAFTKEKMIEKSIAYYDEILKTHQV